MERVKTWKVEPTADGVVLTLNGIEYQLSNSGNSIAFDIAMQDSEVRARAMEATVDRADRAMRTK